MKKKLIIICAMFFTSFAHAQDTITIKFRNQYKAEITTAEVTIGSTVFKADKNGDVKLQLNGADSFLVKVPDYEDSRHSIKEADAEHTIFLHKNFSWTDLLTPMFYIIFGGIWFVVFVVFAETGLFAGFFLPGDSLLFVTGIYSLELVEAGLGIKGTGGFVSLIILGIIISIAGILGNYVGYWFGRKSGPFLFERKDTFFFRKKYLLQAKDFYEKHGGGAIVIARFLPIIRTFAPIVAGIVGMDKKKFAYFNLIGCVAWVFVMLFAGHYLQQLFLHYFNFDLRQHLEVIVVGIILVSTLPIILKLIFPGKKKNTA